MRMRTRPGEEEVAEKKKITVPIFVWVIAVSTIVASFGGTSFLGFNISGFAWVIPLSAAIIVFFRTPGKVYFPVSVWVPWIVIVMIYTIFADTENAFQRSIMLLCPIFIGMTVSKFRVGEKELESFRHLYRYLAIALYGTVIIKTGILITGVLPPTTGLASEVMTGALLCSLFATSYMFGRGRDLAWWSALAAIPVIAVTRMGMIANGLSLPLTFAPMKIVRRVVLTVMIIAAGLGIFYTERVQRKTFYSGSGTFEDLSQDNPDVATGGRRYIWEMMKYEIKNKPFFGHGANASEVFVKRLTRDLAHPHNDWLRLLYDYGYVGTSVFTLCLFLQVLNLLRRAKSATGENRILFNAGATSFIIFALFMLSDNIILYAAFFGNLQFTILGFAYAAQGTVTADSKQEGIPLEKPLWSRIRW